MQLLSSSSLPSRLLLVSLIMMMMMTEMMTVKIIMIEIKMKFQAVFNFTGTTARLEHAG